jgi:hypothetical protein
MIADDLHPKNLGEMQFLMQNSSGSWEGPRYFRILVVGCYIEMYQLFHGLGLYYPEVLSLAVGIWVSYLRLRGLFCVGARFEVIWAVKSG